MKKNILNLSAIAMIALASVFTGCKKDDITPPVVTLTGDASITIPLKGAYTEFGATATDDKDGTITPVVSGDVNTNLTGTYTKTYTATDAAGNVGTATRTIIVIYDLAAMPGTYTCTISGTPDYVYTQTITAGTNNRIIFGKFGDYAGNTSIYADRVGETITLPSQTAVQVGTNPADRTFSGTGSTTQTGFTLTYTETTNGNTINTSETFVKQ